jgi:hypothetical protein
VGNIPIAERALQPAAVGAKSQAGRSLPFSPLIPANASLVRPVQNTSPTREADPMLKKWVVQATRVAIGCGVLFVLVGAGCTGEVIGDPSVEVSQLALTANALGALTAETCVQLNGEQACATYPNPKACDQLVVSVRGDGSTVGRCAITGQAEQVLRGVAQGIPITCRLSPDSGCVQCVDLYGGAVVDTCDGQQAQLFSGEGFQSDNAGTPEPDAPPSTPSPPGGGEGACAPQTVQQAFVNKLNQILQDEGFGFSYAPDLNQLPAGGFFGTGFYFADKVCSGDAPFVEDNTGCDWDAKAQGRCYCEQDDFMGVRCRCARITAVVLAAACAIKPPECDQKGWASAVWSIYGAASQWLNGPFGLPLPSLGGSKTIEGAKGPGDVTCLGSPLVLDLAGDGVELGPVSAGVTFDLTGSGPVRTAWVRGSDDALLAIDRDGSGTIDHGGELFGEGTLLSGRTAADGFEALAALDRPAQGGNDNGLVDPADLMFEQLVLWRDANSDGRTGPGELVPLAAAGIVGLEVRGSSAGSVVDGHGNDLSMRARYLRADGSGGLLVDALFVTTAP